MEIIVSLRENDFSCIARSDSSIITSHNDGVFAGIRKNFQLLQVNRVSDNFRAVRRNESWIYRKLFCRTILEIYASPVDQWFMGPSRHPILLSEHRQLSFPLLYVLKKDLIARELKVVFTDPRFILWILLWNRATQSILKRSLIVSCERWLHLLNFIEHSLPYSLGGIFQLTFRTVSQVLQFFMVSLNLCLVVLLTWGIVIVARR